MTQCELWVGVNLYRAINRERLFVGIGAILDKFRVLIYQSEWDETLKTNLRQKPFSVPTLGPRQQNIGLF